MLQALESEIIAHEPLIDSVATAAQRMIQAKHFASENIKVQLDKLQSELGKLQELTLARKLKLQASLESQTVRVNGCCSTFFVIQYLILCTYEYIYS